MTDPGQSTAGQYIPVGRTRLFADVRGRPGAPALLYLHGGPGMGCGEFMHWQGDLLARDLRLIGLDQRGVLRSDAVADGDRLDEQLLADDCEAVREYLGLDSWSVLGHSFGGRIALRYASQHPDRVRSVVFENPTWDVEATERFRLPVLASLLDELGQPDQARQARELAARPDLCADGYPGEEISPLLGALGDRWFLADPGNGPGMQEAGPDLPDELFERSAAHHERIRAQPAFVASLLPLLDRLTMPALLITGRADLVTTPDQIEAFRQRAPHGEHVAFNRSGHFAQFEQAEEYARVVTDFVHRAG